MITLDAVKWLEDRAKSYSHDMTILQAAGQHEDAGNCRTVCDELRKCAALLSFALRSNPAEWHISTDGGKTWTRTNGTDLMPGEYLLETRVTDHG